MLPSIIENHKDEQDSGMGKMNPVSKATDSDKNTVAEILSKQSFLSSLKTNSSL